MGLRVRGRVIEIQKIVTLNFITLPLFVMIKEYVIPLKSKDKEETLVLLEVKHLTYKADRRTILNNINFKLDRGETVAVVGPSGSGKSTFLKQLNNLISPTGRRIII